MTSKYVNAESAERELFWKLLRKFLAEKSVYESELDKPLDDVSAVLYVFEMFRSASKYRTLKDVPEQLLRDVFLALRQVQQPMYTVEHFAHAAGRSTTYIHGLISTEPSSRARVRISPSQYAKLLAVFINPSDPESVIISRRYRK